MKHHMDDARRHAENNIADVNKLLDRGITNPRDRHMLADIHEKAVRTINDLDKIQRRADLDDDARRYADDVEMRRRRRARMDWDDDIDDDWDDDIEMRRRRSKRTGRFIRGDMDDDRRMDIHPSPYPHYPGTPVMPRQDVRRRADVDDDDIGPGQPNTRR